MKIKSDCHVRKIKLSQRNPQSINRKKLKKFLPIPNKSRSKSPYFSIKEFEEILKFKSNLLKNLNKENLFKNNMINLIKTKKLRKKSPLFYSNFCSTTPKKIMPKFTKTISKPTTDRKRML